MANQYILLLLMLSLCPQVQAYSPLSTSLVSSLPVWLGVHTDMSFLAAITSLSHHPDSGDDCQGGIADPASPALRPLQSTPLARCPLLTTDGHCKCSFKSYKCLNIEETLTPAWLLGLIVDKQTTYSHTRKEEMITKRQNGLTKKIFPAKLTSFSFIVPLLVWLFENTLNRIALKHLLNVS